MSLPSQVSLITPAVDSIITAGHTYIDSQSLIAYIIDRQISTEIERTVPIPVSPSPEDLQSIGEYLMDGIAIPLPQTYALARTALAYLNHHDFVRALYLMFKSVRSQFSLMDTDILASIASSSGASPSSGS